MKLSEEALQEADDLIEPLQQLSEFRAFSLSRATVIRLAIDLGLAELRGRARAAEEGDE